MFLQPHGVTYQTTIELPGEFDGLFKKYFFNLFRPKNAKNDFWVPKIKFRMFFQPHGVTYQTTIELPREFDGSLKKYF